jgi:molybdopterin-guanine dinucleotide biosynthesis protein A
VLVSGDRPAHAGVADATPGLGPVGGLATVIAHCDDGDAVVVPVDMPRLRMATLTALRDALAHSRAACFEAHPLPCALVVDAAARAALAAVVANAPRGASMRSALQALGAVALPCTGAEDFASVNTPEAWAALG